MHPSVYLPELPSPHFRLPLDFVAEADLEGQLRRALAPSMSSSGSHSFARLLPPNLLFEDQEELADIAALPRRIALQEIVTAGENSPRLLVTLVGLRDVPSLVIPRPANWAALLSAIRSSLGVEAGVRLPFQPGSESAPNGGRIDPRHSLVIDVEARTASIVAVDQVNRLLALGIRWKATAS